MRKKNQKIILSDQIRDEWGEVSTGHAEMQDIMTGYN